MATLDSQKRNPPRLVFQWKTEGGSSFRLIAKGDNSPCYRDRLLLEHLERDGLGSERWVLDREWRPNGRSPEADERLLTAFADGIEVAIKERDNAASSRTADD